MGAFALLLAVTHFPSGRQHLSRRSSMATAGNWAVRATAMLCIAHERREGRIPLGQNGVGGGSGLRAK